MPRTSARRGQAVQTPGVEPTQEPEQTIDPSAPKGSAANPLTDAEAAADLAGVPRPAAGDDELPPDVARIIDQRVAAALQAERRARNQAQANPKTGRNDLPTQEEAQAMVNKDPKRRAVLSQAGWVTASAPVKERDESGFAKA